jgi:hypothetical protein
MILHYQIRVGACSLPGLQYSHDIRVPGQSTHDPLFTQESLSIRIAIDTCNEHLYGDCAVQGELGAPVDDSEAAAPDFFSVVESDRTQFRDGGRTLVAPRLDRIAIRHRLPAIHLIANQPTQEQTTS